MTFKYAAKRGHPWWKFWIFGKWIVYRVNQPDYILRGFDKAGATEFVRSINVS